MFVLLKVATTRHGDNRGVLSSYTSGTTLDGSKQVKTQLKTPAALASVVAVAIGVAGCSADTAGEGEETQTLTISSSPEEPTSWDPAQAGTGTTLYYQAVYDTLIRAESDGSFSPLLATSWEYDESMTELTMTIRDDVTFVDGSALTADVVAANLERFGDEVGPDSTMLNALDHVDVVDDETVVLSLVEPDPSLLYSLTNSAGYIASADAIDAGTLDASPAGSGPYVVDEGATTAGSRYTFVRNDDYWGETLPYDTVVLRPIADNAARLNALLSGEVDGALLATVDSGIEAEAAGFTHVPSEVDFQGLYIMDRAGEDVEALGDVRVRQAINYAIDRDLIVEQGLSGQATATSQIWNPDSVGYLDELEGYYDFDPDRARELLAEAGYEDGFSLEMPVVSVFEPTSLTLMQQMLADVGIEVTYHDVAIADLFGQYRAGEWPSTFMQFAAGEDWVLINDYIAADATWNPFQVSSPEVDALIAEYPTASDERRVEIAQEINTLVVEEAWFAPFYRKTEQLFTAEGTRAVPQAGESSPSLYGWMPAE